MAKVLLAVLAGALLIAGVAVLTVPFSHTFTYASECCPSSAVWNGEPGTEPPPPTGTVGVPIDCGPALLEGPREFLLQSFYFFPRPCADPIRTRRVVGGLSLVCGVVAGAASVRVARRSSRSDDQGSEAETVAGSA